MFRERLIMLDLDDETDDLVLVENAIVVPPGPKGQGKWQPSGVLDSEGKFVTNSISWSATDDRINGEPEIPDARDITDLPGTHMFAGISYGHFGHFITESMTRIWALDELRDKIDGLVFTPKNQMKDNLRPFEVYADLINNLGLAGIPITCPTGPVRVERLYVPKQGFGLGDLTGGSRKFRNYINAHAGMNVEAAGAKKIYISRSMLPPERGGILGESKLEEYLTAEGYSIFHPQRESKLDQLAQYKAAEMIIAVDCSPLHLVGYVGNARQHVGILRRRSMAFGELFSRQLGEFKGITCHQVDALVNDWLPENTNRPSRSSFGEIKLVEMYRMLKAAGMIESDTPWEELTLEERNADLHRLEKLHKLRFKPFQPDDSFETSIVPDSADQQA